MIKNNKKRKIKMIWIIGIIVFLLFSIFIFFKMPYSGIKEEFSKDSAKLINNSATINETFTEEDIISLPSPVKKYFEYCGFIGTKKMSFMKATFRNVTFKAGRDKPPIKIDYKQINFVKKPDRLAFIDSSMFGIPFQGYDSYLDGTGSMKGVIAKLFTLFDQRGEDMDKASLVTYLSECLIVPNVALQDFISWEAIDETHAKAVISYYGISASGIFTFNDKGEMTSFTTNDRMATETDGSKQKVRWTAVCSNYIETNGIKMPTELKAIWHYKEGDQVYFDGDNTLIQYDYNM